MVNYETSLFHDLVSFNINFRFSIKGYSRAQKVIWHKYVKYTCSMETVQQNGRFTLFSSKFPSNIYSILHASYFSGRKNKLDSSDGRRIYNLAGKIIPSIDKLLTKAKLILIFMFFFWEKKKIFKLTLNNKKEYFCLKEFVLKIWDETWMKDVEKAFRKSGKSKSVVKKFMKTWKHNFLKLKSDAEQGSILINLN